MLWLPARTGKALRQKQIVPWRIMDKTMTSEFGQDGVGDSPLTKASVDTGCVFSPRSGYPRDYSTIYPYFLRAFAIGLDCLHQSLA
jgi:hypothetical protein